MNLFFYLQTFILNDSFIVILSDHIFFVLCFIKAQPFVKRKPVKPEKKNTGTIAFRVRQVLLYYSSIQSRNFNASAHYNR
jgi:hypothetical protein